LANKSTKVFSRGTLYWSKIVGDHALVSNYDGDGKEWTFEFEPDDTSFLKEFGLLDRLKDPLAYAERLEKKGETEKAEAARSVAEGRGDYLIIRKPELNREGEKNLPFRIIDENNEPWDDRLIGNGSKADLKLNIMEWGPGKKSSIYATAIRVTELVPYESDEFAGMDAPKSETKAKKAPAKKANAKGSADELDDLDDDIPF